MPITNNEAIEYVKKLAEYCMEHYMCKNCIFKPENYEPITDECLFGFTPCDVDSKIREKIRNGGDKMIRRKNKCRSVK